MPEWKIQSNSEKEHILGIIAKQWGTKISLENFDYELLLTPKDKLYIVKKQVLASDLKHMRIDRLGIYFGEIMHGSIRLSIDGSQIIGPYATDNIIVVEEDQVKKWLNGQELEVDPELYTFQIVKSPAGDFMGCGKASNGRLLNYVPKTRRLGTSE